MRYVVCGLVGLGAVLIATAALTFFLDAVHIDARALMGHFPFFTLGTMLMIFVISFRWRLGRNRKRTRSD